MLEIKRHRADEYAAFAQRNVLRLPTGVGGDATARLKRIKKCVSQKRRLRECIPRVCVDLREALKYKDFHAPILTSPDKVRAG